MSARGGMRPDRVRLGMVGGGAGAFIGAVHRIAARIDDRFELIAGALSSTPERAEASGRALGLDPRRSYDDYREMARREAGRADGIEAVAIVTPNHLHYPVAREFLSHGIHVICDKPLTATLGEARLLRAEVEKSGALFMLTHTYSGYPMVRQARAMVAAGTLGPIRLVQMEYAQDWMTETIERDGNKQADWRSDPARAGMGGALGDIGTHAFHLGCFVTGLEPERVAADLDSFGAGRRLDDNAHVLLRFRPKGGVAAKGMLWASQVAPGHANGLRLRVYGTEGALDWEQEQPERLWFTPYGAPKQMLTRGGPGMDPALAGMTRVPAGHPEGYLEAFANLYSEAAEAILARRAGSEVPPDLLCPTVGDGLKGMAFVGACVRSSQRDGTWEAL